MKSFLLLIFAAFSWTSSAQFSEADTEGRSELRVLGKTWSSTFFSLASYETDKADQGGRLSTYNYFSFHTFLSGKSRFSLRLPFTYGTAGTDRFNGDKSNPQELEMQDVILEVRNPEFSYLPWDLGLYWAGRLYVPNSKSSKNMGQIARLRNEFILSKAFSSKFAVELDQKFSYFFQSRTTYPISFEDEYGFTVNATAQTKRMEVEHRLNLWGKITPRTGVGASLFLEDMYWNKSTAERKAKPGERNIAIGPQVRFPLNDSVSFIFSYSDKVNRDQNLKELGQFKDKNTEFVLNSFVTL